MTLSLIGKASTANAYHSTSSIFFGLGFAITLSILPFFTFITVSAISAIKLLCVTIITVFDPSLPSHCFLKSFSTSTPVLLSNAPVGSSHNNNLGFFAIALAILTLCCSPPDN